VPIRAGPEERFCEAVRNDLRVPLTLEGPTRTVHGPVSCGLRRAHPAEQSADEDGDDGLASEHADGTLVARRADLPSGQPVVAVAYRWSPE